MYNVLTITLDNDHFGIPTLMEAKKLALKYYIEGVSPKITIFDYNWNPYFKLGKHVYV